MIQQPRRRTPSISALYVATSAIALAVPGVASAQQAAAPVPGSAQSQETRTEQQNAAGQVGLPETAPEQSTGPGNVQTDDEDAAEDDIVVTGIRRGIADSIELKRNQDSIVEAVSAEDIGKLPDVSIAESIARLPGVAAQRVAGRAQVISIRGLAPDFTTTLLNGRQQASSGDNRSVEFDQYPAELLSSVVIYKTPDARLAGFGLSGTADLRTVRPLEFGKRAIALNLRGEVNDLGKLNDDVRNYGYRASISYIDQFADGKLGIALGYARLDQPSGNQHFKAYNYEVFGGFGGPNDTDPFVSPRSAATSQFINGQELFVTSRLAKRDAFIGIVEWEPSSFYHATLDGYYSTFNQDEIRRGVQFFTNPFADNARAINVVVNDANIVRTGTFTNVVPILRNDVNTRDDELISVGLNNQFTFDDRTRLSLDLSYSRNKREETVLETYAGYGRGVGGVSGDNQNVGRTFDRVDFDYGDGDDFPSYMAGLDYADASRVSLGDRAPWGGWQHDGRISQPDVSESVYSVDLGFTKDVEGFFEGVDLGVNYTRREKEKFVLDQDLFLDPRGVLGGQQVLLDPSELKKPTSLGFAGFGNVIAFNALDVLDKYYTQRQILNNDFYDKNWLIEEDVYTVFMKARINWGRLRGNVGLQIVAVNQESTGTAITNYGQGVIPVPTTDGDEYSNILPSVNLIYDLGGGHRIRGAASKTLARPRMDEMRANVTPSFNIFACNAPGNPCQTPGAIIDAFSGSGGNPRLKPWRADALDLAYEWYINPTTYLSVAGFYKKLNTYIYTQTRVFNFAGIPLPAGANAIPSNVIINPLGPLTSPANGRGGKVQGVEFSGSFNFGTITSGLEGLGVQGSLSLTESDIDTTGNPNPEERVRIPGLSGTVYNLTGYYERAGFQARLNYRYRSGFKGEVQALFATRGATEILADKQMDGQIGYTFQEGSPLAGLGVQLQAYNLLNSPYRTRIGLDFDGPRDGDGGALLQDYEEYGRNFLFGVNYRF